MPNSINIIPQPKPNRKLRTTWVIETKEQLMPQDTYIYEFNAQPHQFTNGDSTYKWEALGIAATVEINDKILRVGGDIVSPDSGTPLAILTNGEYIVGMHGKAYWICSSRSYIELHFADAIKMAQAINKWVETGSELPSFTRTMLCNLMAAEIRREIDTQIINDLIIASQP